MGYRGLVVVAIVLYYLESLGYGNIIQDGSTLERVVEDMYKIHSTWDYRYSDYTQTPGGSYTSENDIGPDSNTGSRRYYILGSSCIYCSDHYRWRLCTIQPHFKRIPSIIKYRFLLEGEGLPKYSTGKTVMDIFHVMGKYFDGRVKWETVKITPLECIQGLPLPFQESGLMGPTGILRIPGTNGFILPFGPVYGHICTW